MAQFKGFDILTDQPNRQIDFSEEVKRSLERLDNATGILMVDTKSDSPVWSRVFEWLLEGRTQIFSFFNWLSQRKGRLVPFWIPTWQKDIELSKDVYSTEQQIFIKEIGYGRFYGLHPARKNLAFIKPDGTFIVKTITSYSSNTAGTEILSLDSPLGDYSKNYFPLISFLVLVRLASDDVEILWHNQNLATVRANFTELPKEAV